MIEIIEGVVVIFLGLLTLLPGIPIIWIGGFLWGGWLILKGIASFFSKTSKISEPINMMPSENDTKNITITCGECGRKAVLPRGKGLVKFNCLGCSKEGNINT